MPMQFRMGDNKAPSAGIGCGGLIAIVGLILISPVGEWLIKGIGWILIIMGLFAIGTGIYFWIKGPRRDEYL